MEAEAVLATAVVPGIGNGTGSGTGRRRRIHGWQRHHSADNRQPDVPPEYSEDARKAKLTGYVMLNIVVTSKGTVTDVQVARSLGMGLDEKAMEAVQKWLFKPGLNKGVPVNVRAQVKVTFTLLLMRHR